MSNFKAFKTAVAKQFEDMQKAAVVVDSGLFRAAIDKDALWALYLSSFPPGTNQMFRQRTEYDCGCCRSFVRTVGDVLAIVGGKVVSIWDVKIPCEPAYQAVADALAAAVRSVAIQDKFLHYEKVAGTDRTFEAISQQGRHSIGADVKTWDHFFVNIAPQFVMKKDKIPTALAGPRESKEMLLRALKEIDLGSVDTVLELISQGSLYRGEEHKHAIEAFRSLKVAFDALATDEAREVFAWAKSGTMGSVARIRNTVIGTLLVDLAAGVDMEHAVKSFETKVAPTNYKRPTALVTKAMVDAAKATVEELGLTSALARRYAALSDVTVNNILFANRSARKALTGSVFDDVAVTAGAKRNLDKIEEVGIEKFLTDILPRMDSVEILVENRHLPNFVSLIAPEDQTSGKLFKWENRFSWSYNGEMADSIKERVKAAGGSVVGDLCCRLAWDYTDDLDFHMHEPDGTHIFYGQYRRSLSPNGGQLDLDANGADGPRPDPAENIFYADRKRMREGLYLLSVDNYHRRSDGRGFVVEVEFDGQVHRMESDKVLKEGETIQVAKIQYRAGGFSIIESLPSSQTSREAWGITTQTFHPVNVVMLSPNHWDEKAVGNKHYFFMIDGCRNAGNARGFFNEFLSSDLDKHRKVLEMVGSKVKVGNADQQLSGLGFSSTMRNSVVCRVKGSFTREVKVVF